MAEKTNTPVKKTTVLSIRLLFILIIRQVGISADAPNQASVVPLIPCWSVAKPPMTRPTTPPTLRTRSWATAVGTG